jgi:hypothetical protein
MIDSEQKNRPSSRASSFKDLKIEEDVVGGVINAVSKVMLPDWWYESNQISPTKNQQYMLKLAPGGDFYIAMNKIRWLWLYLTLICDTLMPLIPFLRLDF